jgi:hypothetical protein
MASSASSSLYSYATAGISDAASEIAIASQLPGRGGGGPADALRHLVLSAELTRVFGDATAVGLLNAHEAEDFSPDRADTAQDTYVNSIGVAIGNFVRQQSGTFQDVVDLSVQALTGSLAAYSWRDFGPAGTINVNEGGFYVPPLDGVTVTLGGVGYTVNPVGLTRWDAWVTNPKDAEKVELTNDQSNWVGPDFFHNWDYELGNKALTYGGADLPNPLVVSGSIIFGNLLSPISTAVGQLRGWWASTVEELPQAQNAWDRSWVAVGNAEALSADAEAAMWREVGNGISSGASWVWSGVQAGARYLGDSLVTPAYGQTAANDIGSAPPAEIVGQEFAALEPTSAPVSSITPSQIVAQDFGALQPNQSSLPAFTDPAAVLTPASTTALFPAVSYTNETQYMGQLLSSPAPSVVDTGTPTDVGAPPPTQAPTVGNDISDPSLNLGGYAYVPVVLDLTGNGINIKQLTSSNEFFDMAGAGQQNLTAWAGAGNGVLFYDPNGTGQLTQANQIIFTDWDPTATSDMQALLDVFIPTMTARSMPAMRISAISS